MKKYPNGKKNKKTGKLKRFFIKSALVLALSTGAVSCNNSNIYTVKKGDTIYSIYEQNKTDEYMTFEEFQTAFIKANVGHIGIEDGVIRADEDYIIPTQKETINSEPEVDDMPNKALDSLMQGETPIATYLKLYKAYEDIDIENKPSFSAVIAHIEQETGMYGQWADKKFKGKKADHFKHNNPFNITYKNDSDVENFYEKKDNIYKDGRRESVMVKFNDYPSLQGGLEDYLKNVTGRQYLLDQLGLGSIAVNNPLIYLYKLESTGYMQGILGAGDVDVYLSRQLNRSYDEKTPIFLVTRTNSTYEIDYEINKVVKLMKKESELKKGRNTFVFGETKKVDGVFMTTIFFKEEGNRNLREDRFKDNVVSKKRMDANRRIDEVETMKSENN